MSLNMRQIEPILPANCFALPRVDNRSASRAYNPPTKAPIEQPPIASTGICSSSSACSMPMWEIPRPPPPPRTRPIDLPHNLRASRAKSFM